MAKVHSLPGISSCRGDRAAAVVPMSLTSRVPTVGCHTRPSRPNPVHAVGASPQDRPLSLVPVGCGDARMFGGVADIDSSRLRFEAFGKHVSKARRSSPHLQVCPGPSRSGIRHHAARSSRSPPPAKPDWREAMRCCRPVQEGPRSVCHIQNRNPRSIESGVAPPSRRQRQEGADHGDRNLPDDGTGPAHAASPTS